MREKAKQILLDNMSDDTTEYLSKIDHLQGWIIDAMIEYNKAMLDGIGADIRNKLTPPLNLCAMVEKLDTDSKLNVKLCRCE